MEIGTWHKPDKKEMKKCSYLTIKDDMVIIFLSFMKKVPSVFKSQYVKQNYKWI